MSQSLFDALVTLLISYEDFEDVVEGIYDIFHLFV